MLEHVQEPVLTLGSLECFEINHVHIATLTASYVVTLSMLRPATNSSSKSLALRMTPKQVFPLLWSTG